MIQPKSSSKVYMNQRAGQKDHIVFSLVCDNVADIFLVDFFKKLIKPFTNIGAADPLHLVEAEET